MSNHFHLLLRPEPGVTISRILRSLAVAHPWRFHRRHRSVGHAWQGWFKSPVVQDDGHLGTVLRYIEANPLRARMVADPADDPWSSHRAHGEGATDPLLTPLPEWANLGRDEPARRSAWRRRVLDDRPESEVEASRRSLRSGLAFGAPTRVESLAARSGRPAERRPPGRPRKAGR